jgi:Mrp family chromosome partitioning ATPase/capsular polysaccharide biosynthesis protein
MSRSAGLDLPKLLALVKERAWLLTAITLVAAGLALVVSLSQDKQYQATAVLLFGGTPSAESLIEGASVDADAASERSTATNVALASLDSVAFRVKRRLRTDATVDELKDAVDIEAQGLSDLVDLTAEWSTADGAARVATTFAEEVVALRRQMARAEIQRAINVLNRTIARLPEGSDEVAALEQRVSELTVLRAVQTSDVRLAERATPPEDPSSPRPVFNAVVAGLVALIVAVGTLVLRAAFDPRIRDERELTALIPAPVLARIPRVARSWRFLPTGARGEDSSFYEAIEFLRLNVQRFRPGRESVVLAVTSPTAGDGKTTLVAWLAQSLAFNEADVVAVDCDLKRPMLNTYFEGAGEVGGGLPNLRVVRAGDEDMLLLNLTGQQPLQDMFDELRGSADYVLVDTSPVGSVAHASAVAAAADGVILILDLGRLRRKELLVATEQLANARANVIGVVLNRVSSDLPTYYSAVGPVRESDIAPNPE